MSSFNIPNVGTLTSTALTVDALNKLWQALTLQILGLTVDPNNPTDPNYALVRIDFPPDGQPAWQQTQDIAFLQVAEETDSYNEQHDQGWQPGTDGNYNQATVYTRVLRISWEIWGPNSWDRARQIKSCLYLDFVHDALAAQGLYLVPPPSTPKRVPQLVANDWWEVVYLSARMNEQVNETLPLPAAQSVEVIGETASGVFVDVTINLSGE